MRPSQDSESEGLGALPCPCCTSLGIVAQTLSTRQHATKEVAQPVPACAGCWGRDAVAALVGPSTHQVTYTSMQHQHQHLLSPANLVGQPAFPDLAGANRSTPAPEAISLQPGMYPPAVPVQYPSAQPAGPRNSEGPSGPGVAHPATSSELPALKPAQSWTQLLKPSRPALDAFADGLEFSVPLEPPSSLKEGSSRMSPGTSVRMLPMRVRPEGTAPMEPLQGSDATILKSHWQRHLVLSIVVIC